MMNKIIGVSLLLYFFSLSISAQNSLNSYKYILVPKQYEFQKSPDKYQINSLIKFLFKRANFNAFFTDENYPNDLANNRCLALKAIVKDNSNMFKTKVAIDLLDCNNNIIYSTAETVSRQKDFKKAYHEVIRENFTEIEALNYKFDNSQESITKTVTAYKINNVTKTQPTKKIPKPIKTIEGRYFIDDLGVCIVYKNGTNYSIAGGTENLDFATIFNTSKQNIYIIQWKAHEQSQLLELDTNGDLKVDTQNGIVIYKRIN